MTENAINIKNTVEAIIFASGEPIERIRLIDSLGISPERLDSILCEIAEEYAKKDSRIKVVHLTTSNISRGRNAGLDEAKGKYIAFVDDDDECDEDFLEFLYNLITENDAEVAICGSTTKDIDEKKVMNNEEAIETLLWRKNYNVAFPTKLIKKELFNENRF